MKEIRTEDAAGQILCHDITQIIKDEKKGVLFSKGHIVKEEDIPLLLSVGKEHLFVWEKKEGILHENEGADILYKICAGDSMHGTDVKEGKIELVADENGVLKIRRDALLAVNSLGEMMIASRHGDFPVKKGDKLAGKAIKAIVKNVVWQENLIFTFAPKKLLFTGNVPRGVFCEQSSQKTRELRREIMRMHDFCASRSALL